MQTPVLKQIMCHVDMWKKMKGKLNSFGSFSVMYLNKTKSVEIKDELYIWSDFDGEVLSEDRKTDVYD